MMEQSSKRKAVSIIVNEQFWTWISWGEQSGKSQKIIPKTGGIIIGKGCWTVIHLGICDRLNNGLGRHPGSNPYVTLQGKRDFADVTKLRLLRWGEYPGSSGWALNVITSVLIGGIQREIAQKSRRRGDDGAGIGGRSHKPRNSGRNEQLKKARKWIHLAKPLDSRV